MGEAWKLGFNYLCIFDLFSGSIMYDTPLVLSTFGLAVLSPNVQNISNVLPNNLKGQNSHLSWFWWVAQCWYQWLITAQEMKYNIIHRQACPSLVSFLSYLPEKQSLIPELKTGGYIYIYICLFSLNGIKAQRVASWIIY